MHGIPSKKRVLRDGDVLSLDIGVRFKGYFTDSATTVAIGEVDATSKQLLAVTEQALEAGIAAAVIGNHIGDIGAAVQAVAEGAGFSVVRDLVGHGIGTEFHEEPQVPNYGKPKRLMKLTQGLTIAIEPMVSVGTREDAHDAGPVDGRDGGRLARGAFRAHDRDHGRWAAGLDERTRRTGRSDPLTVQKTLGATKSA